MLKKTVRNYVFLIAFVTTLQPLAGLNFKKVVIWGHKLHSHTHSYVHFAFYKAFKHLGYETYWLDDNDDVSGVDFSNALFITEGQVDKKIPLRDDCYYILHHCRDRQRFQRLIDSKRVIHLYQYHDHHELFGEQFKIGDLTYANFPEASIAIPWGTDLLPHEIEANKQRIKHIKRTHTIYWVGTIGGGWAGNLNELQPFIRACRENNINFKHVINVSLEQNRDLIQQSYMAPAIVGAWQEQHGYVPCRIFKNISYGQMVATNSRQANELFEKKLIFNKDTYQLFFDAKKRLATVKIADIYELMDMVKDKHPYLNRINTLLEFFDEYLAFDRGA